MAWIGWLVVLGFNATLTAKVISWPSVTHMCFLAFLHQYYHNFSFQSHRLLFSHASAVVRGESKSERKVTSTGDQTHTHQPVAWKESVQSIGKMNSRKTLIGALATMSKKLVKS